MNWRQINQLQTRLAQSVLAGLQRQPGVMLSGCMGSPGKFHSVDRGMSRISAPLSALGLHIAHRPSPRLTGGQHLMEARREWRVPSAGTAERQHRLLDRSAWPTSEVTLPSARVHDAPPGTGTIVVHHPFDGERSAAVAATMS